jgi:hypothetical protein
MTLAYRTTLHRTDRRDDRHELGRVSTLRGEDGRPLDVLLDDISETGLRISQAPALVEGEGVVIGIAGVGTRSANVVWSTDGTAGCELHAPLSREELDITQRIRATVAEFPGTIAIAVPQEDVGAFRRLPFRTRMAVIAASMAGGWLIVGAVAFVGWKLIAR